MAVNWDDVQKALVPIKDYEDLCQRLKVSFGYPFVINVFNYTMPELVDYTHRILGGDSRGRYTEYSSKLIGVFSELHHAGVESMLDLRHVWKIDKVLKVLPNRVGSMRFL